MLPALGRFLTVHKHVSERLNKFDETPNLELFEASHRKIFIAFVWVVIAEKKWLKTQQQLPQ